MAIEDVERIRREHHIQCYGKEAFFWEWCVPEHLGYWIYGGDKDEPLYEYQEIKFIVPKPDRKHGWYCYIGPELFIVKAMPF